jgi:hypothetical protein
MLVILEGKSILMRLVELGSSIQWQPHIGDPTLLGWLTVVAYLLAAVVCAVCAWQADKIFEDAYTWQHRLIWGVLAIGLLFLGINKQLDLQTWFTAVIKETAWEYGLYDLGRRAQVYFIAGMALVSLVVLTVLAWTFRHVWRHYWLLLLGLLFIARFIITRAAGFYGVSLPRLSQFTGGFQINWLLEITGALLIGLAALSNIRRGQKREKGNE